MDYEKIGLKCGIEIHQQLDTKKLFCNCESELIEKDPDFIIERRLRAAAGETEEIDIAAQQEAKKQKKYCYQAYNENTCLIELDEAPPQQINNNVLQIILQVFKILQAEIIDQIQVMRKTVVDGSNTAGFQRTALIAINGKLNTSLGEVGVTNISVEEDSARIITQDEESATYRLDRLGIPLIEIGTSADIKTPEHCKETAEKLGMILRSTRKVKRGLGTIRQDINISIKEGDRIEIKGEQDLALIPKLVENEAKRQQGLVEIKKIIEKKETIKELKFILINDLFQKTESKLLQKALNEKQEIIGIKIKGFSGILGKELMPNHRFGTEISQRLKITLGIGILHSDELPKFGITSQEIDRVREKLNCSKDDAFIISTMKKEKINPAVEIILQRIKEGYVGVPREVRVATPEAITTYLRPLPGASRMYPETDIPKIIITKKIIDEIELPELIEEKIEKYQKLGLGKDLAVLTAKSNKSELFEQFIKEYNNIKPSFIAEIIMSSEKQLNKKITEKEFSFVFDNLNKEKIAKSALLDILASDNPEIEIKKYYLITDEELSKRIKKIIQENKELDQRQLIGKAMQELKGKSESEKIIQVIKLLHK